MEALTSEGQNLGVEPFTFHDLKAKGISDHRGQLRWTPLGQMRKVYVRKLQEIACDLLTMGTTHVTRIETRPNMRDVGTPKTRNLPESGSACGLEPATH